MYEDLRNQIFSSKAFQTLKKDYKITLFLLLGYTSPFLISHALPIPSDDSSMEYLFKAPLVLGGIFVFPILTGCFLMQRFELTKLQSFFAKVLLVHPVIALGGCSHLM